MSQRRREGEVTAADTRAWRRDAVLDAVAQATSADGLDDGWVTARDVQAVYDRWERQSYSGGEGPPVRVLSPQLTAAVKAGELERARVTGWRVYAYRRLRRT